MNSQEKRAPIESIVLGRSDNDVQIGGEQIGFAVRNLQLTDSMGKNPAGVALVAAELLAGRPVDYFAPIRVGKGVGSRIPFGMVGNVTEAVEGGEGLSLRFTSMPELEESYVEHFESKLGVVPEIMHMVVRSAGIPEDRVKFDDLDSFLPLEMIEVLIPITGIEVAREMEIFQAEVLPGERANEIVAEFEESSSRSAFEDAPSVIRVVLPRRRMFDAETDAIAIGEKVVAWLNVRANYGLVAFPNGRLQEFDRRFSRARVRAERFVMVTGLNSGRRWLRARVGADPTSVPTVDALDPTWTPLTVFVDDATVQGMLACSTAATSIDALQRIGALWEAIEYFAAGVKAPKLFAEEDVERAVGAIPQDLPDELRKRLEELAGRANDAPLMARLREALKRCMVPISSEELRLLARLRKIRNHALHGRPYVLPNEDELLQATSIVSRMLVFRIYASARLAGGSQSAWRIN